MILRLVAVLGFMLFSSTAHADSVVAVDALSGDDISLKDGHILRLADIKAAVPEAKDFLQSLVQNAELTIENPVTDRYGRVSATARIVGHNQSLQDEMLKAGMAFVYPAVGDVDALLADEQLARGDKSGYWRDHPDISSDDAEKLYGSYGFVIGVVTKAERVKNKIYLNFGADWRTDFTIAIAAHDLRAFKKQDIDVLSWQGKRLRVRGWVKRDFGPMITVSDPHQIELLSASVL